MNYPIIPPVQASNQGTYQAQTFTQNQTQGVQEVVKQPGYQLAVPQPGTVPQGGQGVQDKAKAFLENLLTQCNQ